MDRPIYLDYHATAPLDPRVRQAMEDFLDGGPANPHSATHAYGWRAAEAIDEARRQVARLISARPEEIVFTSGASEANNLAILGAAAARGGKRHIVTSAIEHPSVLATCRHLELQGYDVDLVPVDREGLVDPASVAAVLREDTALVSVMLANNEIGTLQPIREIGALCRARGILLHGDAAQAAGKIPLDVAALQLDLMSLSAHKLCGPMGVGALYVRNGVRLRSHSYGGAQERGLRPGTVPAPLAVGFGEACELAAAEMGEEARRVAGLRDRLLTALRAGIPDLVVNGSLDRRLPGNLNLRVPGIDAEDWLLACPDLALSAGAACASGEQKPSHVLKALGLTPQEVQASIRIGLGRFTSEAEIDRAAALLLAGLPARQG